MTQGVRRPADRYGGRLSGRSSGSSTGKGRPTPRRDAATGRAGGVGPLWGSADWSRPGWLLLPLRAFLGVTFLYAGLQKLADPLFFDRHSPTSMQSQLAAFKAHSPIAFLLGPVQHHPVLFGSLIAITEIAVGLATLLGLLSRWAALVGMALALSFYLTASWNTVPYYYGADIVFLFAWTPLAIAGSAGVLSADAWLAERRARAGIGAPTRGDRREVVAVGATAAAVGLGALVLGGLDAIFGRLLSPGRKVRSAAAPQAPAPTPSAAATHSGGGAPAAGTAIGSTSKLPVGGALAFTDPKSGDPAFAVQPKAGHYAAFSAVCTHAGCTVGFSGGQFQCPCHGGVYDGATGQVLAGPPPAPLGKIKISAEGGQLRVD